MGFWQDLTGETAADASKQAAADTFAKQQAAIAGLRQYGDEYAGKFENLSHGYDPYVSTGLTSNNLLQRLLSDPSSVRSLPGYQFNMDEGVQALDRSAASRGRLNSGRQSSDLVRFGQGLADNTYGNQLARLMGLSQQGVGATGAQIGTQAQGLSGQLGTRQSAYGGDMTAANTIGLGDIAGANARSAGSQNLLNAGLKLGGMALGAFGGAPGMGTFGGGSSSYGGSPGYNAGPAMGGAGAGYDQFGRPYNWGG